MQDTRHTLARKCFAFGAYGAAALLFCSFLPMVPQPTTAGEFPHSFQTRSKTSKKNAHNAWRYITEVLATPGNYNALGYAVKVAHQEGLTLEQLMQVAKETKCVPLKDAIIATKRMEKFQSETSLSQGECLQLSLFIETELAARVAKDENYVSMKSSGLPRSIEYDPESGLTFIHLKTHGGVAPLGAGVRKIVYKSIQYDRDKPEIVAHCYTNAPVRHEISALKMLQGLPGLMEFRSITDRELSNGVKSSSIMCKLYRYGTMAEFLSKKGASLSLEDKIRLALDVMKGVESLHSRNFVHRDINSRNFLVDRIARENGDGKRYSGVVADLGRTRQIDEVSGKAAQGNPYYIAPEAYIQEKVHGSDYFGTDIYATGCVFHLIHTGRRGPWMRTYVIKERRLSPERAQINLLKELKIYREGRLSQLDAKAPYRLETSLSDRFERLVLRMIDENPEKRGTATELRKSLEEIVASMDA